MNNYIVFIMICGICELSQQKVVNGGHNDDEEASNGGYSFHKFSGPVSGEVQEIYVPDVHKGGQRVDFIAKPDYSYSYGVKDPATGNSQEHQESRDGDTVHGQYSVLQADGSTRVVRYTADALNGFQATVEYH